MLSTSRRARKAAVQMAVTVSAKTLRSKGCFVNLRFPHVSLFHPFSIAARFCSQLRQQLAHVVQQQEELADNIKIAQEVTQSTVRTSDWLLR